MFKLVPCEELLSWKPHQAGGGPQAEVLVLGGGPCECLTLLTWS